MLMPYIEPGYFLGLPNIQYHYAPGISKSGLDMIARSPAHYQASQAIPRTETPAMRLGTAMHCAVLEPNRYPDRYIRAIDGIDRRTKEGKNAWKEFEQQAQGKTILMIEEWDAVARMSESISIHQSASGLLMEGHSEVSVFAELEGIQVKCRPDWIREDGIVVDLKTTRNASPRAFAKSVANFRYQVQDSFYRDVITSSGFEVTAFVFIAVESSPPYQVAVYTLESEAVDLGRRLYQRDLATYRTCLSQDYWPGYSDEVMTLALPGYAYYQEEE